jgi:hypothetical protein
MVKPLRREPTMPTPEQRIRDLYGFAFPDDFFRFREFLGRLPHGALGQACDMHPAFPFAAAAGRAPREYPRHPLWEDRYYHDLPEFVTLFNGTTDGLHWGYFFDAPGEHPPVVAHYWHSDTFEHATDGDTIFEAVRWCVERNERDLLEMADEELDEEEYRENLGQLAVIREELARSWNASRPETGDEYLDAYGNGAWRKPTAPTWSRMGVVVPRGRYRKLSIDPFAGYRADPQRSQVEGLSTEALGLIEKGFPGAALKLGHDLWVWAGDFPECYALLDAAYAALGREPLRRLLAEARAFREECDGRSRRRKK